MAYGVTHISKVEAWTATDYDADDLALDLDVTTCMTNGTPAEDCDEWKEGVLNGKVEINIPGSSILTLKVRFYFNSVMTAGKNALLPYVSENSVSITNEVVKDYTTPGQWIEHICSPAFIAQLADVGGKCYVRLASGELGSSGISKPKMGEVEIDVTYLTYKYEGVTLDKDGNPLGGCAVALAKNLGGTPPTYEFVAALISHATTGVFSFTGQGNFLGRFYAIKLGSPDRMDCSPNDIVGVLE